jgi:hypothetical protein
MYQERSYCVCDVSTDVDNCSRNAGRTFAAGRELNSLQCCALAENVFK